VRPRHQRSRPVLWAAAPPRAAVAAGRVQPRAGQVQALRVRAPARVRVPLGAQEQVQALVWPLQPVRWLAWVGVLRGQASAPPEPVLPAVWSLASVRVLLL